MHTQDQTTIRKSLNWKFYLLGLLSLMIMWGVQTNVHAQATSKPNKVESAHAVRIVCLAEDFTNFEENLPAILAVTGFYEMLGLSSKKLSVAEVMKMLKVTYPPVGRWNFVPIGSGFVVSTGKNAQGNDASWVATNWHVAKACPEKRPVWDEKLKDYVGKDTGLSLGILEPLDGEIRPIMADLRTTKEGRDEKGNTVGIPYFIKALCRNYSDPCNAHVPPYSLFSKDQEIRLSNNVLFYAPDVAILALREKTKILPLPINTSEILDSQSRMEIQGFPQVAMQSQQEVNGSRAQLAEHVLTTATFSRMQSFSNEKPGVRLDDVIKVNLMFLAAQVHPGNSGGPVLLDGKVVGMITSTITINNIRSPKKSAIEEVGEDALADKNVIPAGYALAVTASDIVKALDFFKVPYVKPVPPKPVLQAEPIKASAAVQEEKPTEGEQRTNPMIWVLLALAAVIGIFVGVAVWRKKQEELLPAPGPEINDTKPAPTPTPKPAAPTPVVRLRASHGPLTGTFPMPGSNGSMALFAGRDPATCQIIFPNTLTAISQLHCSFVWNPQTKTLVVKDLSTHGTFVNGEKLEKSVARILKSGDTIDLAEKNANRFTVEIL